MLVLSICIYTCEYCKNIKLVSELKKNACGLATTIFQRDFSGDPSIKAGLNPLILKRRIVVLSNLKFS